MPTAKATSNYKNQEIREIYQSSTEILNLDNRISQSLQPIELPDNLQERFNRAKKRAAVKDGKSLYQEVRAKEKQKLLMPEVVASHKMRMFEAKSNPYSFSYDPLDSSMDKLSIKSKEEVLSRVHEKIKIVTDEVHSKYAKRQKEMDKHGVFHASVNAHRTQSKCLTELQKKLNLEKLRDEAIKELGQKNANQSNKLDDNNDLEGKLNVLLRKNDKSSRIRKTKKNFINLLNKRSSEGLIPDSQKAVGSSNITLPKLIEKNKVLKTLISKNHSPFGADSGEDPKPGGDAYLSNHPHIALLVATLSQEENGKTNIAKSKNKLANQDAISSSNVRMWHERTDLFRRIGNDLCQKLRKSLESKLWDSIIESDSPARKTIEIMPSYRRDSRRSHLFDEPNCTSSQYVSFQEKREKANQDYKRGQTEIRSRIGDLKRCATAPRSLDNLDTPDTVGSNLIENDQEEESANQAKLNFRTQKRDSTSFKRMEPPARLPIMHPKPVNQRTIGRHSVMRILKRRSVACTWEWTKPDKLESVHEPIHEDTCDDSIYDSSTKTSSLEYMHNLTSTVNFNNAQLFPSKSHDQKKTDTSTSLQSRLESVWEKLETPFYVKLEVLEKYAHNEDPNALHLAVKLWEDTTEAVLSRERLLKLLKDKIPYSAEAGINIIDFENLVPQSCISSSSTVSSEETYCNIESYLATLTAKCTELILSLRTESGHDFIFQGENYLRKLMKSSK